MWSKIVLGLLAGVCVQSLEFQYLDDGLGELAWYGRDISWPLAVLPDKSYTLTSDTTRVPLLAVPSHEMALINNPYISSYSPDSNLVTCQLNKFSMEALPAVRVELPWPVLLRGDEGSLTFPSHLSVENHGVRFMMPVGALLAPIPDEHYSPYHMLNVVYAVPALSFRQPLPWNRYPSYVPLSYPKPNGVSLLNNDNHKAPITVLEFPSKIPTPNVLARPHYQVDEELVNRGPPQEVVIPAGLIQSTQPKPFLTDFVNSKESPLLPIFRDEANKHRDSKPIVEAL